MRWLRKAKAAATPDDSDAELQRLGVELAAEADHRRRLLVGQEHVVAELEALLFRHDPIAINVGDNTDEYHVEAETITLRRHEAQSVDDVRRITHEEFEHWFGADLAGPQERYQRIAEDIWRVWTRRELT